MHVRVKTTGMSAHTLRRTSVEKALVTAGGGPALAVNEPYVCRSLERLIAIPSVNPAFDPESPGEARIAAFVEQELEALGLQTRRFESVPGRTSVVGTLSGRGRGRSLMLYAHYDTVAAGSMEKPFEPQTRNNQMYGRGAYDMKAGLAACLGAIKALRDGAVAMAGDVLIVAVADEETASIGIQDVLRDVRADAAIVTEPTGLDLCLAHKGFMWIEVSTRGRAAHGSRFDEGIDANMRMGRFLGELAVLEQDLRLRAPHALVGPPSLHAAVLQGGSGVSTYAATCRLEIERRTIPGESGVAVAAEIRRISEKLAGHDPGFDCSVRTILERDGFEVSPGAPIVEVVGRQAEAVLGRPPAITGASYWMDAAFLSAAGIETVVIGPAGAGAHADVEWVDLNSVVELARILAGATAEYCA
jgi:acetylornithine deacetylase